MNIYGFYIVAYRLWFIYSKNGYLPREVQEFTSCSFHKVGCLTWSSVYARILKKKYDLMPVTECLDSKRKGKQAKSNWFLLLSLLYKLPQKVLVQIKVDLIASKKSRYTMDLST